MEYGTNLTETEAIRLANEVHQIGSPNLDRIDFLTDENLGKIDVANKTKLKIKVFDINEHKINKALNDMELRRRLFQKSENFLPRINTPVFSNEIESWGMCACFEIKDGFSIRSERGSKTNDELDDFYWHVSVEDPSRSNYNNCDEGYIELPMGEVA
tara:strand:- start:275 stop:745 length:471 start_codon:yes stop_codon:yes gene_type:complete